jgi:plasmid stabilization system protein ParE
MTLPVVYLPEAEADIAAAVAWYDGQSPGLGDQLLGALRQVIDYIRDNPQLYGAFRRDIRAAPLSRFPYVVYYRDRGNDVLVIAVQDGRRSSRAWLRRASP